MKSFIWFCKASKAWSPTLTRAERKEHVCHALEVYESFKSITFE
jgi:hypothetical protein